MTHRKIPVAHKELLVVMNETLSTKEIATVMEQKLSSVGSCKSGVPFMSPMGYKEEDFMMTDPLGYQNCSDAIGGNCGGNPKKSGVGSSRHPTRCLEASDPYSRSAPGLTHRVSPDDEIPHIRQLQHQIFLVYRPRNALQSLSVHVNVSTNYEAYGHICAIGHLSREIRKGLQQKLVSNSHLRPETRVNEREKYGFINRVGGLHRGRSHWVLRQIQWVTTWAGRNIDRKRAGWDSWCGDQWYGGIMHLKCYIWGVGSQGWWLMAFVISVRLFQKGGKAGYAFFRGQQGAGEVLSTFSQKVQSIQSSKNQLKPAKPLG
ncbi:hypothetical protein BS47DRAFT_1358499 [Hydnum rufescens UP504]|uniref:Uncharacterized protein n=1 Tax=Hydnum rufescens UP504 TaxID=1448309 RepID=A0A9P6E196_9AGAM|nr:hypothetical protein BS47DRAFT_1358499 [Hydnum rufescens UP504]